MSTDVIEEFEGSLQGTVSATDRIEPGEFAGTLEDHVERPAVGVPLPFEGVTYEGTAVEPLGSAADLLSLHTGVTPAGTGIANYGTVTVRSTPEGDELVSLYAERHVAVVAESDVVPDMAAAFDRFGGEIPAGRESGDGRATQVLETGASSTADLGALVEGVHGPREVHVLILEGR